MIVLHVGMQGRKLFSLEHSNAKCHKMTLMVKLLITDVT